MCTIKFSTELNIYQIDDKDLTTNICEKSAQIFKMDNTLVHLPPVYINFLDDSAERHLPSKVLLIKKNK